MIRSLAPRHLLVLTLLIPAAACSDDNDDSGGNDEVGDGDGDPTGDGDGDGDQTGDGDGDGDQTGDGDGDGDQTGDGDGDQTGDGDGDGDGDQTGDGDGDGDPPYVDNGTYTATVMPGIPDRIIITRVNNDEPTCTRMVLYSPGFDTFDITIPLGYAVEEALVWQQGFCPMNLANPHGMPTSGSGTIHFASYDALMTYPCTLNFNLEIDNATDPPSMSKWQKNGVPVQGVNCG